MSIHTHRTAFLTHLLQSFPAVLLLSAGALVATWMCWPASAKARDNSTRQTQAVPTLEVGKTVERQLNGIEKHSYQITLEKHQYVRVVIQEIGLDVKATLLDTSSLD